MVDVGVQGIGEMERRIKDRTLGAVWGSIVKPKLDEEFLCSKDLTVWSD